MIATAKSAIRHFRQAACLAEGRDEDLPDDSPSSLGCVYFPYRTRRLMWSASAF